MVLNRASLARALVTWLAGEPIEIFEYGIYQSSPPGIDAAGTCGKQIEQIASLFGRLVPIRRGRSDQLVL